MTDVLGHNDSSVEVKMYHGVCLKVLDVVYMCRQDVYKKLFQLATGHFETSAKERFVYIEANGIRTLLYHVIIFNYFSPHAVLSEYCIPRDLT